jgi:hypothetical protein
MQRGFLPEIQAEIEGRFAPLAFNAKGEYLGIRYNDC